MRQRNASSTTNARRAFKERLKDDDGRLTITLDLIKQGPGVSFHMSPHKRFVATQLQGMVLKATAVMV